MKQLREEFTRFMMLYKFGIDEVTTKLSILQEEFSLVHDYNPIEHLTSRLKTPESIIHKVKRKQCNPSFDSIRASVMDIAGVRITCSFVSDTYRVFDMLTGQQDIRVVEVKDYIKNPKPNGYKSLHAILEVPVFMSTGVVPVMVEVQIRTVAMDFWASLEHKIYYKYNKDVPANLVGELRAAADTANQLDLTMERLHDEVKKFEQSSVVVPTTTRATERPKLSDRTLRDLNEARQSFFQHSDSE
ncbi:GTP pyrophosphokinase [Klugiella xanthotipulae]|nr:GTP pyrophosphokinase family protein [Klugiella xanthotipulae]